ncbi:THAP domain-containing protein 1-like [Sebastes umbrosus]|uniref:THAP domain-containing protein 1-like n=1 Tax=Sebastes umbrosus TaxID=72105 RepID=UPI0018A00D0B|nr:THAP domain-containing protein 1-like [Sebastes umbrosus]
MVRHCVFPGCSNKEVSWSPYRFHRVPLNDTGLKQLWLVTLNIDLDTPVAKLRELRVCSDHFSEEDYLKPRPNKLDRHLLKRTAVPNHQVLPSPEQSLLPRERPSTSGADLALPAVKSEPELHDTWGVMDGPPGQDNSTGNQMNVPETCTATTEKPTLQHIVDEEAILQLMKNCPMCDRKCRCSKRTCGPYFIVYQSCYFCNYQRKWANQPEARSMNIHKANVPPKKRLRPKNKASVNAKAQSSQLNKTSISESSVSESHDQLKT